MAGGFKMPDIETIMKGTFLTWGIVAGMGIILSKYFEVPPFGLALTVLLIAITAYASYTLVIANKQVGLNKTDILLLALMVGLTLVSMFLLPDLLPGIYDTARTEAMSLVGLS